MNLHFGKNRLVILVAAAMASSSAFAAAPVGDAHSYDLSISIDLLGLTSLEVGAQASASISSTTVTDSDSSTLPSVNLGDVLNLISVTSGTLTSEAEYQAGAMSAIASANVVEDLNISVETPLAGILNIGAGVVKTTAALSGFCPETLPKAPFGTDSLLDDFLFGTGFDAGNLHTGNDPVDGDGPGIGGLPPTEAQILDPEISILETAITDLPALPPPNTTIDLSNLGIAGVVLVLNEQSTLGDGVHSLWTGTNGIHLTANIASLITADIIISHSEAGLTCL